MRRCQVLNLGLVEYGEAWAFQRDLFRARSHDEINDTLLIVQHPPTYTFGRRTWAGLSIAENYPPLQGEGQGGDGFSGEPHPHLNPLPEGEEISISMGGSDQCVSGEPLAHPAIYWVDRGGGATYHGPGQVVGYPIIALRGYTSDLHVYLRMLEEVIIRVLKDFEIESGRLKGYTGVWVCGEKIGSIGVRVIRGVTMHGFSLNVNNDLAPFDRIVPCNIQGVRMTSMSRVLGTDLILSEVEESVTDHFAGVFKVEIERVSNPLQTCLV